MELRKPGCEGLPEIDGIDADCLVETPVGERQGFDRALVKLCAAFANGLREARACRSDRLARAVHAADQRRLLKELRQKQATAKTNFDDAVATRRSQLHQGKRVQTRVGAVHEM